MSYRHVSDHRSMVFDTVRNRLYLRALESMDCKGKVVIDAGAGLGILGLLAAKAGAARVYLVEPEDIILVAERIASINGLSDRVVTVHGRVDDVELPESADVIVHALPGNFLLGENLLPVLYAARRRWLKHAGSLLPDRGRMTVTLLGRGETGPDVVERWSESVFGLDFDSVRPLAANRLYHGRSVLDSLPPLSEPGRLVEVDFSTATDTKLDAVCRLPAVTDGELCGLAGWSELRIGDQWLSTGPADPEVHWSPVLMPIDPPLAVRRAEEVEVRIRHTSTGEWGWRVASQAGSRTHGSFLGTIVHPESLAKAADGYRPVLSPVGRAVRHTLDHFDGHHTTREISEQLIHSGLMPAEPDQVMRLVARLVRKYG